MSHKFNQVFSDSYVYSTVRISSVDGAVGSTTILASDPEEIFIYDQNEGGTGTFTYTLPLLADVAVGRKYTFVHRGSDPLDTVDIVEDAGDGGVPIQTLLGSNGPTFNAITFLNYGGGDWLSIYNQSF